MKREELIETTATKLLSKYTKDGIVKVLSDFAESLSPAAEGEDGKPTEKELINLYATNLLGKYTKDSIMVVLRSLVDDINNIHNRPSPRPSPTAEAILLKKCAENKVYLTSNELHTILDAMTEFASLKPTEEKPMTAEEVQRCPVCGGNGLVPNGFYNTVTGIWSTTSITPEVCRSCNGTGIVFPYASKPTVAERADERITEEKLIPQIIEGLIAAHKLHFMKIDDSCTYEEVALLISSRLILNFARTVAEREVPEDIITELEKENPYPETVFLPMSESDITEVAEYLKKGGYSIDSLAGNTMRRSWNLCVGRLRELIKERSK
jgi:hypothetical protein